MIENIATVVVYFFAAYAVTKIWQSLVRDFFAWTIWMQDNKHFHERNKIHRPEEMAYWAYQMADSMMKERSK
jgi:hypothetical protein